MGNRRRAARPITRQRTKTTPGAVLGGTTPGEYTPGRIIPAPQYAIEDGVSYRLPAVLPFEVTRSGPAAITEFVESVRSTYRFQFDNPNRSGFYDGQVWMPVDDPLCEWDSQTRQAVLTECHAAFHRNPLAKAAVALTRQFAVGKGHTVTARNKQIQAVIDTFRANPENAVFDYDRTFVQDLQVDGELFIRKVAGGVEGSVIAQLPPWYITEIATAPGFLRRIEGYHLSYSQITTSVDGGINPEMVDEWIKPGDVLHVAINRHGYELRGRSDLFVILPWLRAYKEWLENRARQNHWRGSLLWDVAIAANDPNLINNARANYATPPTPGSVVVHSDKEQWQALTNPISAGDAAEDGRQMKLMTAVGMQLPEYMLSDGENANLASATAQQLPALWRFVDMQQLLAEQVWTPIYRWVIEQAVAAGVVEALVEVEDGDGDPIRDAEGNAEWIAAVDAFAVQYPDLQAEDPKTLAEALQIAVMNGWASNETAANTMGFDWAQEQKRILREKEMARDEVAQGLRQMPLPGMGDDEDSDNPEDQPDQDVADDGNQNPQADTAER